MEGLKKMRPLWDKINDLENELADLQAIYEGSTVSVNGSSGTIDYIDPANECAKVVFENKESQLVDFQKLY